MDASLVLTLVQTFLQVLDSPISGEIQSVWGYKSQLQKLKDTMSTIKDVLSSVEKQEKLTSLPSTLDRLKEAVYEADDLFDEIATLAQRKKLSMPGNKVSKEVRLFFSRFNQFYYAFTKSHEIKKIRERLDDIKKDHQFVEMQGQAPTSEVGNNSRETYSFVCEEDAIIGRDEDKQRVIDMLVDDATVEGVSVVSIVGIGGLGKTALAKLVYNDDCIQREFQLKMWVCVSDDFNVRAILSKILTEATNQSVDSGVSMEYLQKNIRSNLEGKKYLIVLDDIWNEVPNNWHMLRNLLIQGGRGSRIIVTTRSMGVAKIVGSHQTHQLKGLSDEDSWKLFEKMTLEPGQVQLEAHLVDIGKVIIRKCANVPLAIRVIGSLLRGEGEYTWRKLKHTDLANMKQDENGGIIPVLKMSYNYLPSHLKSCFTFCAVYPKDYKIMKEDLIYLWMAEGFIMPLNEQSFEDLGEEYFINLLQRCFFQDVERDDGSGDIISCKMHDLVHDLAKDVAGIGIKSSSDESNSSNDKARHIFIDDNTVGIENFECYLSKMRRLRTCLVCHQVNSIRSYDWLPKMIYLRVLDLSQALSQNSFGEKRNLKRLPSKIGQLVHLRYLNLSHNVDLCVLPSSITQLCNLQTLKLEGCWRLKKLPKELSKLVNLRHLDIRDYHDLRHMPPKMNRMTSLRKLPMFVLGGSNDRSCDVGGLGDLKYLENLTDKIEIKMLEGWRYDYAQAKERGYMINKPLLNEIIISWNLEFVDDDNAEVLLQGLQPHRNVKKLSLNDYPGVNFPSWLDGDSSTMNLSKTLPNLVELHLWNCERLKHVPLLSQLRHLKVLWLSGLSKLEYVESRDENSASSSGDGAATASGGTRQAHDDELVFFPSLEKLKLWNMPKLKGWWKASSHSDSGEDEIEIGDNNHEKLQQQQLQQESSIVAFPRLSHLCMWNCPNLTTFPSLPNLEEFSLNGSEKVVRFFNSLPRESFQHLSSLLIRHDNEIESLSTMEVFRSGRLSSLRSLRLSWCWKLKTVSERGVWEHFTALETLELTDLKELEMENNEDADNDKDMPWRCLAPSLCELTFGLGKMVQLPMGMRHLTALRSLNIEYCDNLEEIPGWISCLTSLHHLYICHCLKVKSVPEEMRHLTSLKELKLILCSAELKERCEEGTGADWHIIQHIPFIQLS